MTVLSDIYFLTGYQELGIVYLDQLTGARHTHTLILSQQVQDKPVSTFCIISALSFRRSDPARFNAIVPYLYPNYFKDYYLSTKIFEDIGVHNPRHLIFEKSK